jgi:hypothetical protein
MVKIGLKEDNQKSHFPDLFVRHLVASIIDVAFK